MSVLKLKYSPVLVQVYIAYNCLLSASLPFTPKLYEASGNTGSNMEGTLWILGTEFTG